MFRSSVAKSMAFFRSMKVPFLFWEPSRATMSRVPWRYFSGSMPKGTGSLS